MLSDCFFRGIIKYQNNASNLKNIISIIRQYGETKKKYFDYKKSRPWAENLYIVTQLGFTMVGCITFCFFIGLYLDKWLGTRGVFITIFIILGVIGGANVVYRQILEITEQKENDKSNEGNGGA